MTTAPVEVVLPYYARGGNLELFSAHDEEILLVGGAGSGKTRACLELIHHMCLQFANLRVLMIRKDRATLASTALAELTQHVLHPLDNVKSYGGSELQPPGLYYPNGATIFYGGMNDPGQIFSSFYDVIYVNEATEITEEQWELLGTRLRNPVLKHRRLIGDCNPTYAKHWLNRRCLPRWEDGRTLPPLCRRITSTLKDNPLYYDDDGNLTENGEGYFRRLDNLKGSMRERFLLGNWVGVENAVYPHFDRHLHIRPLEPGILFRNGAIGVDYGRRHKSAVVAISVDQYGRRWVREAWGEPDEQQGGMTRREVARQRTLYSIYRGRADPTQDALAGSLGFNTAKTGPGSRNSRIQATARLFNIFPGGLVPESYRELTEVDKRNQATMLGPHPTPDSPGLLFVAYPDNDPRQAGINALADEIESYHEVLVESDLNSEFKVARVDDDLPAALEYAIEELEQPGWDHAGMAAMFKTGKPQPVQSRQQLRRQFRRQ